MFSLVRVVLDYINHVIFSRTTLTNEMLQKRSFRRPIRSLTLKVKSCYNPLRFGTVIVLVSSGIDVCIATEPPAERDCEFGHYGLCQSEPKVPGLYKKHKATQPIMPEMRLEPLNVCLTDRRRNQLS